MRSNRNGGPLPLVLLLLRCTAVIVVVALGLPPNNPPAGSQLRITEEEDESQSLLLQARVVVVSGVVANCSWRWRIGDGTSRIRGFLLACLPMVSWKSAWIGVDEGRLLEYATTPSVMLMQLCGNASWW